MYVPVTCELLDTIGREKNQRNIDPKMLKKNTAVN